MCLRSIANARRGWLVVGSMGGEGGHAGDGGVRLWQPDDFRAPGAARNRKLRRTDPPAMHHVGYALSGPAFGYAG